ncbi:hypothetical protein DFH01_16595 [Falsiroseomonas bella]|uniref:histidine kinase n=1 Tax=Falsiroseomonas bella TaxID=2184016 RepID=A0A317FGI8_9PROT|nr:HWE histidine kinase domain-containing protein [Falsiroseomonas bella]PWS36748.1 hypothetical protein DFH01_16595 [Falsiroseomonas bella]
MSALPLPAFGEADLSNCDREPIHIPGSVQPHGLLLVLHPESLEVLQAAGDGGLLGAGAAPAAGQAAADLLPAAVLAEIASLPEEPAPTAGRALEAALPGGGVLDIVAHRTPAGIILEIEPLEGAGGAVRPGPLPVVLSMIARLGEAGTLGAFCQAAADEVRRVTGFDRVMVYRFAPDDSGEVIAEARDAGIGAYLGLHYPASDVPRQARELYVQNWLRIIPDARYVPAPLVPPVSPLTGRPTDLSCCALRSVSPLHLDYLANMGVRASMSLSIVQGGRLWGLIACHHRTPHRVPVAIRGACELFARMFSLQIEAKQRAEDHAHAERMHRVHEGLVRVMAREDNLALGLIRQRPNLLDFMDSAGVALLIEGNYAALGRVPEEEQVRAFAAWAGSRAEDGVLVLDSLAEAFPPARGFAAVAAGALVLSLTRDPRDCIIWFRPEVVQTVTWAGNPNKPVEVTGGGARVAPRRSFAAWRETVRGRCRPWRAIEVEAAQALRVSLLEVVLRRMDEVARERAEARQRQDLLLAELDHRVKNTLANIQALVRHSSRNAGSVGGFVTDLHGRLRAMAKAHSLLSRSRWEGAGLRSLVEEELHPHLGAEGGMPRIGIVGPDIRLRPKAALAVSLALHELATNAVKHGALSVPAGRVQVSWRVAEGKLLLEWRESGGPPVAAPGHRGFGSMMIERSLAYEVGGTTKLDFRPEGILFHVEMPLRHVAEAGVAPDGPGAGQDAAPALRGLRVLVVEDSALVAMELETALRAQGAEVIGPVARIEEAAAAILPVPPDAALLDIDLDGVAVFPLADALAAAGVPFVFTTGYEARLVLPPRFAGRPVLAKPYRGEDAAAALAALRPAGAR